jgi:hypothetical protein
MRFWAYLAALVGLVLWAIERGFNSHVFSALASLSLVDRLFLVGIAASPAVLALCWDARRAEPHRSTHETVLFVVFAAIVGLAGSMLVYDATNKTAVVAVVAATAATIGWILQRQVALDVSRKQHTLSILLQLRQSELFNRHRINLFASYPDGVSIPAADVPTLLSARTLATNYSTNPNGTQTFPMVESVYFICNFYEFLAAAVRQGDIDSHLLRQALGGNIMGVFAKCEHLLNADLKPDPTGQPTSTTWENYWWLVKRHWK